MNNPINNTTFDSRDLVEYRDELEQEIIDAYNERMQENDEEWEDIDSVDDITDDDFASEWEEQIQELEEINSFISQLEDYGDFEHGEQIIHEDYFTEYAEEFVKELGYLPDNFPYWIENHIDWEGVADDLKADYTEAEYQGDTYYMRA